MSRIKYYSQAYWKEPNASVKPRKDFESVLKSFKATPWPLPSKEFVSFKLFDLYGLLNYYMARLFVPKNKHLIFQFPYQRGIRQLVNKAKAKGNIITFLVHDIDKIRIQENDSLIDVLELADNLILHTEAMKDWVLENTKYKGEIVILNLFDYLLPQVDGLEKNKTDEKIKIAFCGNLAKSKFLQDLDLPENIQLVLYGIGCDEKLKSKPWVDYRGVADPQDLPDLIKDCDYGLVWDGDSVEICSGTYGTYLKYNAPHKLSLYLVSGLPLIVWSGMGLAKFIKERKIGILIDDLRNLPRELNAITREEEIKMIDNVKIIRKELSEGKMFHKACSTIFNSKRD